LGPPSSGVVLWGLTTEEPAGRNMGGRCVQITLLEGDRCSRCANWELVVEEFLESFTLDFGSGDLMRSLVG